MTLQAVIKHTYSAPVETLFTAFTNPEILKNWYCPEGLSIPEIVADVRVGGKHRVVMLAPDGNKHIANGIYKEVVPGKKLVYTWKWEGQNADTTVTIEFFPQGSNTEVVLTHEGLHDEKEVQMHTKGWTSCLMKLGKI